jgi:hypothetical protein
MSIKRYWIYYKNLYYVFINILLVIMSFLTVLKEGGIVPYLYKNKTAEQFNNWVPYYEDITSMGQQINPKQDMLQAIGVYLLAIVIAIFGILSIIIIVNYLIGTAAAKLILYIAMNILPHILGLLLFSYYYIVFITSLYYITKKMSKTKTDAETVILPGNVVIPPAQRSTVSIHL